MGRPIRILQVFGALNRGGAETMMMNIYRNMDISKVQFDFIIHTSEECDYCSEIVNRGGRIYRVPKYTGVNHYEYKKAWENFFKTHGEYKIVHGHMRSTAAIYVNIAKKYGITTIVHSHSTASRGNKVEQLVKNIFQLPIRYSADYLLACSKEAGRWLFGTRAVTKGNYRIVKNAIDVHSYLFNEEKRQEVRRSLNIEDKLVIGHVGSFTQPKNHKFLLDIFYQVKREKENAVLMLLGDGELRPEIENKIKELGLKDKVILMGVVENVKDYLQAMDVFVFPSLWEGLPVTLIEAQATGLPCLISDNITNEVKVTTNIQFLPLKASPSFWADRAVSIEKIDRTKVNDYVMKSGFDIGDSLKKITSFYEEIIKIKYKSNGD